VLFLDELPEFNPQALDSLRQPLESGEVAIARANHRIVYPARFQLVAAMNPCRCGHADEPGYACRRGPNARCVAQYQRGCRDPLLDRFDLTIDVPAVAAADLLQPPPREGSAEIAERVAAARTIQAERYRALGLDRVACKRRRPANVVEAVARRRLRRCSLLRDAAERMRLSARGYHRVLKARPHARRPRRRRRRSGAPISPSALSYRGPQEDAPPPQRDAAARAFGRAATGRERPERLERALRFPRFRAILA